MQWINYFPFYYVWLERIIKANPVLFSTVFPKELLRSVSLSHYILRCIYHVVVYYFLLDCQLLCWSKLFILRCKKYIIFVRFGGGVNWYVCIIEMYVNMFINSLPTNVMICKVQGFVNWFYTSMIGQFGFVEYTSFKYFLIITKGSQLIYWYLKYEYYKCLLVVNLSEYQDYINICN